MVNSSVRGGVWGHASFLGSRLIGMGLLLAAMALGGGCSQQKGSSALITLLPALLPTSGELSQPSPEVPPAEKPPEAFTKPEQTPPSGEGTPEAPRERDDLFSRYMIVAGISMKQAGMNADPTSDSSDAATFLPKGPRGHDYLTGETVSSTYSPLLNVSSPVTYFGERPFGFGYNSGAFTVRFTDYMGMFPVRKVSGELRGTFAYFVPTLILTNRKNEGLGSWVRMRNEIGVGITAYQFTGEMTVHRESVFPGVDYQDRYRGPGGVRWGGILYAELRAYFFERIIFSFSQFLLQTSGYYYYEYNYNVGWGFPFGGSR